MKRTKQYYKEKAKTSFVKTKVIYKDFENRRRLNALVGKNVVKSYDGIDKSFDDLIEVDSFYNEVKKEYFCKTIKRNSYGKTYGGYKIFHIMNINNMKGRIPKVVYDFLNKIHKEYPVLTFSVYNNNWLDQDKAADFISNLDIYSNYKDFVIGVNIIWDDRDKEDPMNYTVTIGGKYQYYEERVFELKGLPNDEKKFSYILAAIEKIKGTCAEGYTYGKHDYFSMPNFAENNNPKRIKRVIVSKKVGGVVPNRNKNKPLKRECWT